MSPVIEVFRGEDYVPDGEIPLLPLLRAAFGEITGPEAGGVSFGLSFHELTDPAEDHGQPALENLRASHGFVQVAIWRDGTLLYRRSHPVRELIAEPLRDLLVARDPHVPRWGYAVRAPGLEHVGLVRPAPAVAHELLVGAAPRGPSTFTVAAAPEPEPPRSSLAALGVSEAGVPDVPAPGTAPLVAVVVPAGLATSLLRSYPFSEQVEDGGFLAGHVYRDSARPDGYVLRVTAVLAAERTGASAISFTFTGESFLRVGERLAARDRGETLLGWYHTHLFPASPRSGLSALDVELHRSTFRRPWQLAALVNITSEGRTLHFYHGSDGGDLMRVPYWTLPDRT